MRRVEISDEFGKLKLIFSDDFGDLPSVIRNLDEDNDLDTEVDVDINIQIVSRQRKMTDFKKLVGKELKEAGIDVEVLDDE